MDDITKREPRRITAEDINPRYNWGRHLPVLGTMGVDFEERVDYRRLQRYRLARAQAALEKSDLGALLVFDVNNIRYLTSTKIGEWERDKLSRWALLTRGGGDPIIWDFGSAAVHHKLYSPWLKPENCKAGLVGLRGTVDPSFGLMKHHAEEMASILRDAGVAKMPLGVDIIEPPMMFELEKAGLKVADGQQVMLEAREIKSADEIALLNRAAAMVDGAYHLINEKLKPGVRENDIVAEVNKFLYTHGSDDVEAINAISGERCNPHPHNFTDRMIRPGDQAFFDILQSFMGYRTCYYRTFNVGRATPAQRDAYKQCREWLDKAIELIKPGVSTDTIAKVWPKADKFGFPNEIVAHSGCNSATVLVCTCTSGRSSAASCRSTIRPRSRKAWCSRSRPTAPRPTAIRRRASKKRSSSPTRAARSSACSRPRNFRSPHNTRDEAQS